MITYWSTTANNNHQLQWVGYDPTRMDGSWATPLAKMRAKCTILIAVSACNHARKMHNTGMNYRKRGSS